MLNRPPMHRRIADEICARIENGTYGVGDVLPTELQLASELRVSRGTVREALRRVTELGMIERVRKRGTTVLRERPLARYQQFLRGIDDLMHYATDTRLHINAMSSIGPHHDLVPKRVSRRVDGWLCIEGWRSAAHSNIPISWTRLFINKRYESVRERLSSADTAVFTLVENEYGIRVSDVDQTISAIPIEGATAKELSVPEGTAGLRVDRVLSTDDNVVEYTINIHPGATQSYSMRFERRPGI